MYAICVLCIASFFSNNRVVAVDMRGFGESEKPKGIRNYAIDKLTNDVKVGVS